MSPKTLQNGNFSENRDEWARLVASHCCDDIITCFSAFKALSLLKITVGNQWLDRFQQGVRVRDKRFALFEALASVRVCRKILTQHLSHNHVANLINDQDVLVENLIGHDR